MLGNLYSTCIASDPMQRRPSLHGGRHWGPPPNTIDTYHTLLPFPASLMPPNTCLMDKYLAVMAITYGGIRRTQYAFNSQPCNCISRIKDRIQSDVCAPVPYNIIHGLTSVWVCSIPPCLYGTCIAVPPSKALQCEQLQSFGKQGKQPPPGWLGLYGVLWRQGRPSRHNLSILVQRCALGIHLSRAG